MHPPPTRTAAAPLPTGPTPRHGSAAARDATTATGYLYQTYWWAYAHPRALRLFERQWLVNAILFGQYRRLCDAALAALAGDGEAGPAASAAALPGRTLQVACVYGDLTVRLQQRLAADARLDVVDALPAQIANLAAKLPADARVHLAHGDAAALPFADASVERVLMFFLLHEMPDAVKRAALAEALRVLKPGGRLVLVDYHRPPVWHPLRPLLRLVFAALEPFAATLWQQGLEHFLPPGSWRLARQTLLGGLYQVVTIRR